MRTSAKANKDRIGRHEGVSDAGQREMSPAITDLNNTKALLDELT